MTVALEFLSTHTPGAPVVDDRNEFIGLLSESDVRRALEVGKDLSKLNVKHIHVAAPC
jgi:predicted transcriptional regulator